MSVAWESVAAAVDRCLCGRPSERADREVCDICASEMCAGCFRSCTRCGEATCRECIGWMGWCVACVADEAVEYDRIQRGLQRDYALLTEGHYWFMSACMIAVAVAGVWWVVR